MIHERLISFLLMVYLLMPVMPVMGEEYSSPSDGILHMRYADDHLSLETKEAPLKRVLEEMSRLADVRIIADGPVEGQVTIHVEDIPTDVAARKVLKGKDTSFLYRSNKPGDSPEPYHLAEIRIYVSEGDFSPEHSFSYTKKPSTTQPSPKAIGSPEPAPTQSVPPADSRTAVRKSDPAPPDFKGMEPEEVIGALLGGDEDALNKLNENLKDQDPEVQEEVHELLRTLEQARAEAEAAGEETPPMGNLGAMGTIMQHVLRGQRGKE